MGRLEVGEPGYVDMRRGTGVFASGAGVRMESPLMQALLPMFSC